MKESICILIPVYNEIHFTKQCLKNLDNCVEHYKKTQERAIKIKIIVIDDGSTDGTSDWIRNHYPDVILCHGNGNLFWSAAINMGIEHVQSLEDDPSYILFWNKDLYIEKTYFTILHNLIKSKEDKVIFASKMYRKSEPNILFSFGGFYSPITDTKINIGTGKKDEKSFEKTLQVDWCGGMAVTIPSDLFKEIGLCDYEQFPQYDGDTDLFLRAGKAGYKLLVFPELKAWNVHENTGRKEQFTFKNLKWYLTNIRSYKNFKIGYSFYKKHAKGPLAFFFFIGRHLIFITKYCVKILISRFK